MTFRDDREAAYQRAESLEQELARTQRELDELRAGKRKASPGRARWVAAGVAFLALVGGSGLIWKNAQDEARAQAARHAREAEAQVQAVRARVVMAAREQAVEAQRRLEAEAVAQREAAARAAAEAARPTADLTWSGHLEEAVGVDVPVGSPCTLEGTFAGPEPRDFRSLRVQCGGHVLFGPELPPASSGRLREGPTLAGGHEYLLSYRAAARDAAQIALSTLQHRVTVTRAGDPPVRAVVFVRDVSAPREGPALLDGAWAHMMRHRAPAFGAPLEFAMRVRAARGAAPARAGARCEVFARPVWEYEANCRLAIRCGGAWVYGAGEAGYLTCALRDGRPVGALDDRTTPEGGDPRVNWRDGRIVVSDFTEAGEWRLDLGP
ncbi:MAG: hypothetical protein U0324_36805 [Polyangiales bacterium]